MRKFDYCRPTSTDLLEDPIGLHPVGIEPTNMPIMSWLLYHSAMDALLGSNKRLEHIDIMTI